MREREKRERERERERKREREWDGMGMGMGMMVVRVVRHRKEEEKGTFQGKEGAWRGGEEGSCRGARGGVLTILIFEMASPQSSSRYFAFLE